MSNLFSLHIYHYYPYVTIIYLQNYIFPKELDFYQKSYLVKLIITNLYLIIHLIIFDSLLHIL